MLDIVQREICNHNKKRNEAGPPYLAEAGEHPDCGGGWMVYMGQSMPGLGNQAKSVDGKPMLNWWPFLFY